MGGWEDGGFLSESPTPRNGGVSEQGRERAAHTHTPTGPEEEGVGAVPRHSMSSEGAKGAAAAGGATTEMAKAVEAMLVQMQVGVGVCVDACFHLRVCTYACVQACTHACTKCDFRTSAHVHLCARVHARTRGANAPPCLHAHCTSPTRTLDACLPQLRVVCVAVRRACP